MEIQMDRKGLPLAASNGYSIHWRLVVVWLSPDSLKSFKSTSKELQKLSFQRLYLVWLINQKHAPMEIFQEFRVDRPKRLSFAHFAKRKTVKNKILFLHSQYLQLQVLLAKVHTLDLLSDEELNDWIWNQIDYVHSALHRFNLLELHCLIEHVNIACQTMNWDRFQDAQKSIVEWSRKTKVEIFRVIFHCHFKDVELLMSSLVEHTSISWLEYIKLWGCRFVQLSLVACIAPCVCLCFCGKGCGRFLERTCGTGLECGCWCLTHT
jgi:hypothetical protein